MCQQRGGVAWGSVTAQSDQRVAVDGDQWYTARVVTLLANDHPSLDHAGTVVMPARLIVFVMVTAFVMPLPMVMPIAMSAVATVVMALVVMTAVLAIGHGWSDKAQAKHKGQCQ